MAWSTVRTRRRWRRTSGRARECIADVLIRLPPADFDGDCSVGILDLLALLANWD
ncbi:MAG: hypothetical protein IID28_09070 [Planctomycetes bacterium]|nr:hypothetical protein [Planctomycetota bacterium]